MMLGQRPADLVGLVLDVRVEERLRHDREREPHHLVVHVELLSVTPLLARAHRELDHHLAVAADAVAMKRRLRQPPLPEVKLSFAREQAFAEDHLGALDDEALHE